MSESFDVSRFFSERILAPYPEVSEKCRAFLREIFEAARLGHLCVYDPEFGESYPTEVMDQFLVCEKGRWYLRRNKQIEDLFLFHLERLTSKSPDISLPSELPLEKFSLEIEQKEAILQASRYPLCLICGGPGTGKTHTARALVELFSKWIPPERICIGAPTGKATANLREKLSVCCPIDTIHALIQKKRVFSADLILVDEASMIDAKTLALLFSQVRCGTRTVLIGDPFQLPPVEEGNLFADLTREGKTPKVALQKCLRAELAEVIDLAACAKKGDPLAHHPLPSVKELLAILKEKIPFEKLEQSYFQFCLLSPLRQGPYGVDALNQALYEIHMMQCRDAPIPVLITQNDAKRGVFNGDIGFFSSQTGQVRFKDGKIVPAALLPSFEWAYALSIHKSQGSEYDEVMILIPPGSEKFGKEILYTAITRARKSATIYADSAILSEMLKKETWRRSGVN